jgi:hypothetical protein
MVRDNREVEHTLLNKFAFTPATTRGIDHRWVQLALPDLPPIFTKFSHTREDIGPHLWKIIAGQLRVQSNYLNGMIDCTKNREDYYMQVRTAPNPPWNHLMLGTATTPDASAKKRYVTKRPRRRKK